MRICRFLNNVISFKIIVKMRVFYIYGNYIIVFGWVYVLLIFKG